MKHRKLRVAEVLHGFLANEVRQLHDPFADRISLTEVDISPDLKHAKVFFSVRAALGVSSVGFVASESEIAQAQEVLTRSKNFLKKQVATGLNLRYTPELLFRYDNSMDIGTKIDQLLFSISDREVADQATPLDAESRSPETASSSKDSSDDNL